MTTYGFFGVVFFGFVFTVGTLATVMQVVENKAKNKKRRIARRKVLRSANKKQFLNDEKEKRLLYYEILGGAYDN